MSTEARPARTSWLFLLPLGCLVVLGAYAWGRRAATSRAHGSVAMDAGPKLDTAELRAARSAYLDGLSRRLDGEAVDPTWSQETEGAITRVVSRELGPAVSVAEARCATAICRVKLSHPGSPRIPDDQLVKFTLHRESLGTMEIQFDTRAEGSTTLYLLRRGSLSAPESDQR